MKTFKFTTEKGINYQLSEKEKRFCEIYCQFGISGIEAVQEAGYKTSKTATAYSIASEYLRKPKIMAYIDLLYKEYKFTDEEVMREHWYLIKQKHDLTNKARAIDMYYKKTGVYKQEQQEIAPDRSYEEYSDEELNAFIDKRFVDWAKNKGYQLQYNS